MVLIDVCMYAAVLGMIGEDPRPLTTNIAIDFLRRGRRHPLRGVHPTSTEVSIAVSRAVTAGSYMAELSKSKQQMREETERLVKEAIERKAVSVKQGNTRVETICGKCGAPNRVSASPGQVRVEYRCKECGHAQRTM